MDWVPTLAILVGLLVVLFMSGMPVAFAFLGLNFAALYIWMGGMKALFAVVPGGVAILTNFILVPVPLFILMGEILFHSGVAWLTINAIDKWIGDIPGRLSLVGVGAGVIFATVSGVSMAMIALLGTVLYPAMRREGYSKEMSIGPIIGAGSLAMIIPPTALGVVLGALAEVSIGKLLISLIVPGLLLATLYVVYIVVRARLQPHLAPPPRTVRKVSISEKIASLRHILPLGIIIFLVTVVIFLGVATPSEAAATGALGSFILVVMYRRLSWDTVKKSLLGTVRITSMVFLICMGSTVFSHVLAYTGATHGLVRVITGVALQPIVILILMQLVLIILGTFMDQVSMMMICIPIYMPIIRAFGFDPVWFCVMMLINLEIAGISPPFGLMLFVMKGVVADGTTMGEIIRSSFPFFLMGALAIGILLAFPIVAQWLPGLMRGG